MKTRVLLVMLSISMLFCQGAGATSYYFSSVNGNDGNSGTSSGSPKQTISAMQTIINGLSAGDNIYLERGSVWYEASLTISSKTGTSGSPIVFDAYGTGNNPVLSGQKVLSSPSQSGNIYTFTDGDIPNINLTTYSYGRRVLGYVTLDGVPYSTSRHPNTGYYTSSASSISSVSDDLSWSTNEWQNGWIAMKVHNWQWSLARVTSNTSTTLTTTQHDPFVPSGEKLYYFLNAYNAMDQNGEWFWNNGSFSVYWSGTLPEVAVSVVDTIIGITGSDYIYINNIDLKGANHYCVCIEHGDNNQINQCKIIGAGEDGVRIYGNIQQPGAAGIDTENNSVVNSEVMDCLYTGIFSRYAMGGNFSNNYIHRISINSGYQNRTKQNEYIDDDVAGYAIAVWNNVATDIEPVIKQNFIDSVQAGIISEYNGYSLTIRENFVRNYGLGDLGDLGGCYIVSDNYSSVNKKKINKNFFIDAIEPSSDARYNNYSDSYTHAVYFDIDTYGTKADSNSIENAQIALLTNSGIARSFNCNNILNPITYSSIHTEHRANIFNSYNLALNGGGTARADTFINNNVVFSDLGEVGYRFARVESTYGCSLPYQGEIDYNKWFDPSSSSSTVAKIYDLYTPDGSYTLSQWQTLSENCSGDANDPGDNSSYNTSYSDPILLKNWSASAHTFTLSANYVDVDGNTVTGSTSVPAFYSKLLFKTSGTETNSDLYGDTTLVPNLTSDILQGDAGSSTTYALTISYAGTGSGSVSPGSGSYQIDTTLSLTATPNSGSIFAGWSGDTTATTNPLSVVMWTNKSLTATFTDTTSSPASDTIAYWRFENNVYDETGVHDATAYGSPYYSNPAAEGSYSINLNGTGYYLDCDTITLGDEFSISGYVLIWGTSGTRPLFGTTGFSSPDGILATVDLATGVFSLITGDGTNSATATSTTGNFTSGSWIKFEYIVDRSANTCDIKIDDSDESSSTTIVGGFTDGQTFLIGIDADHSYQVWGQMDACLIVGDGGGGTPTPTQTVTITATDANASEEGTDNGVFTFSRGTATTDTLVVSFTASGTAITGTDFYPNLFGIVIIPDGQSSATITIQPIDDAIDESDETITFTLASGTGYTVGTPSSATVTIADNDDPELDTIGKINFTYSSAYDATGWTNVYTSSTFNESLGDGVYFSTSETLSAGVNGEPSTIFPTNVGSTYHFIETTDNTAKYYTLSGLDTTHTYRFSFFESRDDNVSGDRTTTYTIDGSSVGMNPIGNTDSLVTISDVDPDSSGNIDITVTKISGQYGYINALLIIDEGLKRAKIRSDELIDEILEPIGYYPVPVTSVLNLKHVPAESIITVYDMLGNKVYQTKSGLGTDMQIDMSRFKSGMYLFRVIDKTATKLNTFKIMKK